MNKVDAVKIWRYMQQFAHYTDLKDLNHKFLPELAKVEQHIVNFQVEIDATKLIIRNFDENLTKKSGKENVEILFSQLDNEKLKTNSLNKLT